MLYEISTEASFSAAHHLVNYNGPCENVHGHNWIVRAVYRCKQLDEQGLGIDFKVLKAALREITDSLDHRDINRVFDKEGLNPSSENIARHVFEKLSAKLPKDRGKLYRVEVSETPGNRASVIDE